MTGGQLDLFAAPAPAKAAPAARPAPIVPTPRPTPGARFTGLEPRTLEAMAWVTLAAELEDGRILLAADGWQAAMTERARLVQHQIAGTLTPGAGEALAALQRLHLAWAGEAPGGAVITPAWALADLHDAIAGLRLAPPEAP